MVLLLGKKEIDAGTLWAAHPPQIRHPKKLAILELAGGPARIPKGALVISRWAPAEDSPARLGPAMRTESVEGPFTYPEPEEGVEAWHVNFADPELFAFYGGPAFAQDEIQVAEHPILASVRGLLASGGEIPPRTRDHGEAYRPTPVLVRDVERWAAIDTAPEAASPYGIYGRRLGRASDEALAQAVTRLDGAPRTNILAMSAPQGMGKYSPEQIRDVIVTACTGFQAARRESRDGARVRIHTGHWGTGAFGGDRVLMAAAQVIAARVAAIEELLYYSLDDDGPRAVAAGLRIAEAIAEDTSLDDMVGVLHARGFCWGRSDGN
jgi:hypothetical protein